MRRNVVSNQALDIVGVCSNRIGTVYSMPPADRGQAEGEVRDRSLGVPPTWRNRWRMLLRLFCVASAKLPKVVELRYKPTVAATVPAATRFAPITIGAALLSFGFLLFPFDMATSLWDVC